MAKKKPKDSLGEFMLGEIAIRAERQSRDLLPYICAIYRPDKNQEPEQFGTGVYLSIGDAFFLVTAAHVLDEAEDATLYVPTASGPLVELEGIAHKSKSDTEDRRDDRTDIAILDLKTSLVERIGRNCFLPLSMIDVDDIGKPGATYIAMGYPAKRNEKINRAERTFKRRLISYTANILSPDDLAKVALHTGSHLLLSFKKRHSRDTMGTDVTAPDPYGMSGGPLWRFDAYGKSAPSAHLVAIMIEWRQELGGILAVRLPVVLAAIGLEYPQLVTLIPQTRTVQVTIKTVPPPVHFPTCAEKIATFHPPPHEKTGSP